MPVARLVLVVVCTLVPAALETIVAHTAMLLVHSIVGSLGHIIILLLIILLLRRSVVVGPCFALLLLLLRCTLVHGNPLTHLPASVACSFAFSFVSLPCRGSFTFCLSFDRCVS